jgi:hypothetical protein
MIVKRNEDKYYILLRNCKNNVGVVAFYVPSTGVRVNIFFFFFLVPLMF